jgi:hypothetical protein
VLLTLHYEINLWAPTDFPKIQSATCIFRNFYHCAISSAGVRQLAAGQGHGRILVPQIIEHDAEQGLIGDLGIGLSGAGEIGIDLNAITDVGNQQERRPAVIDG